MDDAAWDPVTVAAPLQRAAEAHRRSETGRTGGQLVLAADV